MIRHTCTIGSTSYVLAQGLGIDHLKTQMVEAIRSGGGFVDFVVFGNRGISVLVSPGTSIVFETAEVDLDDRDTGDVARPFTTIDEWAL
ncbi:hypothetical protein ELQ90_08335 [Labedella phragmitis]|uniref:Uncharacterized protein n=1 Tax=Labedella phragmitis TaxID=2498849 RepID=A0A3S3Z9Q6_9MICO|nr:hypothetical protein [Labedella phragmitis]RWZ50837.1 hypothetical protein ELQ90_08335 [Labedella phragmitis]